ncbi:hypothetical protein AVP43_02587 [Geobacillus stearothermophilus]|jgi:hypothetical protein|nr:hypothetical protein AVP43_02587 [Geobacillus stearothermophilus]
MKKKTHTLEHGQKRLNRLGVSFFVGLIVTMVYCSLFLFKKNRNKFLFG